jgi:hypothetical protein
VQNILICHKNIPILSIGQNKPSTFICPKHRRDRMYAVRRFIAVYLSTRLWPGFILVQGDESPDAIKSGPYPVTSVIDG